MNKKLLKYFPLLFLLSTALIFFYKYFIHSLIPIPSDIIVGMYYPWLNNLGENISGLPVKNPLMSDIVSIIFQWRTLAINAIKNGYFPLWNPYYFLGMPLFANFQNSLINITNISFLLPLNINHQWAIMIWLQLPLCLCFSYFFLKSLKLKTTASLLGSIVFTYSLFTTTWLQYGVHVYTASFIPLSFYLLEKYSKSLNSKYLFFLSISLALQIYGGYPQYAIYNFLLLGFYYLVIHAKFNIKNTLFIVPYFLLALGLAAPILLPGYELMARSIHHIDITASGSFNGFFPFYNLVTAPVANFWGNPATRDYFGFGFYDNNVFFPGSFAFISFFLLLPLFFKRKLPKHISFFLLIIPLSFLVAVENPISIFLRQNFGFIFSGNGLATRIFVLGNFSFSILAAYCLHYLSSNKIKPIALLPIFLWLSTLLFLSKTKQPYMSPVAFKNTLYSSSFFLLISTLLITSSFITKFKKYLIFFILLISISELFYFNWKYLPFSPQNYLFPNTPITDFLKDNSQHYRISNHDVIPENMWVPYGLVSPDGSDATVPLLNYEYLSIVQNGRIPSQAIRSQKITNINQPLFNSLSSKYSLKLDLSESPTADLPTEFLKDKYKIAFINDNVKIVENLQVLPRIRFTNKVIVMSKTDDISNVLSTQFDENLNILYSQPDTNLEMVNGCSGTQKSINIIKDDPNQIVVETQNDCPAFLLLSDAYYPGWKAFVNDQSTPIYQSNHAFRSIFLPAGDHHVKFIYQPQTFYVGLLISAISFFLLLLTRIIKNK